MRRWYDDLCQFINKQSSSNNLTTNNNNLLAKHCIVVDAVAKESNLTNHYVDNSFNQLNGQNQIQPKPRASKTKSANPIFKLLSYVNEIKNGDCVDCTNNNQIEDKIVNSDCLNNENNLNIQNVIRNKIYINSVVNSPSLLNNLNCNLKDDATLVKHQQDYLINKSSQKGKCLKKAKF